LLIKGKSALDVVSDSAIFYTWLFDVVSGGTFRHSLARHLLEAGYDIGTVEELLGHEDVKITMIYTDVLNRAGKGVKSPADSL